MFFVLPSVSFATPSKWSVKPLRVKVEAFGKELERLPTTAPPIETLPAALVSTLLRSTVTASVESFATFELTLLADSRRVDLGVLGVVEVAEPNFARTCFIGDDEQAVFNLRGAYFKVAADCQGVVGIQIVERNIGDTFGNCDEVGSVARSYSCAPAQALIESVPLEMIVSSKSVALTTQALSLVMIFCGVEVAAV